MSTEPVTLGSLEESVGKQNGNQDQGHLHPGIKKMPVMWVNDEVAKSMGLETEEQKKAFFKEQERIADEMHREHIESKLPIVRGKPRDKIPNGLCYEIYILPEDEIELKKCEEANGEESDEYFRLWFERHKTRYCPYFKPTKYGTVICEFLEEESVGINSGDYDLALKHFGSEEEVDRHCSGSILLADAIGVCESVIAELKKRGI